MAAQPHLAGETRFQNLAANIPGMIYQFCLAADGSTSTPYVSPGCYDLYELDPEAVMAGTHNLYLMAHPDDRPRLEELIADSARTLLPFSHEWRIVTPSGNVKWVQGISRPEPQVDGAIIWDGVVIDINDRKWAEAQLQQQAKNDQLLAAIVQTINRSVQLEQVLQGCLEQIRQFFQSDRVLICRFDADYNLVIEREALSRPERSLLNQTIVDPCFDQGWAERYRQGYVTACNDAQSSDLAPCYAALLAQMQVRASLAVGILENDQIWGIMIVHYCNAPREWQSSDIDLLKQLGLQIGIANQKALLYTQLHAELAERRRTEAALKISEQNLRTIFNTVSSAIFVHDLQGMILNANDSALRIYGLEPEQITQISVLEHCSAPNNPFHLAQGFCERALAGETVNFEWNSRKLSDGTVFEVDITLNRIVLDGEPVILSNVQDISDRKQAERQLQESQQFLRLLIDNIPHLVAWKDRNSTFLGCNRAAAHAFGIDSPEQIVGKTDSDLFIPEEVEWYRECDRRVMESGQAELHIIEPQHQADGTLHWLDTNKIPLRDPDNNVIGILITIEDITDRKQAEAALREKEQFLRSIYDGAKLLIVVTDVMADGSFRLAGMNASAKEMSGISGVEAMVGKTPIEVHGEQMGKAIQAILAECVQQGTTLSNEDTFTLNDQEKWLLATHHPLRNEAGQIYRIITTTIDITDRKQAETQLNQRSAELEQTLQALQRTQAQMIQSEKMSGLGQLVAGVAHEINNPVNFIFGNLTHANGYTQDLLDLLQLYQTHYPAPHPAIQQAIAAIDLDFLLEDLPKLLASMRVGAERIQKIVASLRTFSRMDEAEVKSVDIHEGIDSTLMILQHRLKAKPDHPGIAVTKNYGKLPLILCYAGQLNQVFMNVLSNAIDALEDRLERQRPFSPAITIQTEQPTPSHICIRITDNGLGIPESTQSRLFDPFFTTKPVGKGTGMGLSISHQIITEKHNGTIRCLSEPGQGTTFIITIPTQQQNQG